jgi:hypothetical protein
MIKKIVQSLISCLSVVDVKSVIENRIKNMTPEEKQAILAVVQAAAAGVVKSAVSK